MKTKSNIFWGVLLIIVGLFSLSRMLGVEIYIASSIMYILVGLFLLSYSLLEFTKKQWKFLPFFTFYSGLGFLFYVLIIQPKIIVSIANIESPWAFIGPAAILAVGSTVLMKNSRTKHVHRSSKKQTTYHQFQQEKEKNYFTDATDILNIQESFSSSLTVATSQQFQGGLVSNRFSETVIDLKKIDLKQDAILTVDNMLGSVHITLPRDLSIKIIPISNTFSSIEQYGEESETKRSYQLTIHIDVKFGSVKVYRA